MTNILPVTNGRRWTVVGLLFTASLINYFDRSTLFMALPAISKELHLGPEAKGVLTSAFFWSYALMQIPIGWVADRVNLRWLYAGMFALWSVAQGLTGFAETFAMLIVLRLLLGIGESIYLPGGSKIVGLLPQRAWLAGGHFRRGDAHRAGAGGIARAFESVVFWLAQNVRRGRICCFVMAPSLVALYATPTKG